MSIGRAGLRARAGSTGDAEHGAALTIVLIGTSALLSLGLGFVSLTATETAIAGHHRASVEAFYVADAAAEYTAGALLRTPTWDQVLDGSQRSPFTSGSGSLATGIDLVAETAIVQHEMDAEIGSGTDKPVWQPFASGPSSVLVGDPVPEMPTFVVWVADDAAEVDGDPATDSNGVITVLARAFGTHGTRRTVLVSLARVPNEAAESDDGEEGKGSSMTTHIRSWREVR